MPWIQSKFDGKCSECGEDISIGDKIFWNSENKDIFCEPCAPVESLPMTDAARRVQRDAVRNALNSKKVR